MKTIFTQLVFLCLVLTISCENKRALSHDLSNKNTPQTVANAKVFIDLVALTPAQLGNTQTVKVSDQVFKTEKTYLAYDFKKLLLPYLKMGLVDVADYEIIFVCGDGYRPTIKLDKLLRGAPYLAFRDVEAKQGDWSTVKNVTFPPFYLVWTNVTMDDHSWAMPYGLVSIEIKRIDDKLVPKDTALMAGFVLFRDRCNRCHQLNGIGGDMGMELNYPKSVTEYWKEPDLKAFIKHPTSYRQNAKMPEIQVNDEQIDDIVAYLKYMAQHKM